MIDESNTETVPREDDAAGMRWWNNATHNERRFWLDKANSARPVDAWRAYKASGERDLSGSDNHDY